MERNADVVCMASYAPLFAHVTGWQWTPDLIWFDNARVYKTPNYYVQQLFSLNRGTHSAPPFAAGHPITGQDSIWASAVMDTATHELILKLVNPSAQPLSRTLTLADVRTLGTATLTTLGNLSPFTTNGFDAEPVHPVTSTLPVSGSSIPLTLQPYTLTVLRVKSQ
jgi:alpha-L-arabinofuranosidase